MGMLEKAIILACEAHDGQTDKAGELYILHPLRVMLAAHKNGHDDRVCAAAVLHDVIEDAGFDVFRRADFLDQNAYLAVMILTRRDGEVYNDYINRVCSGRSWSAEMARVVKILDLEDNLLRLHRLDDNARKSLGKRYSAALRRLRGLDDRVPHDISGGAE